MPLSDLQVLKEGRKQVSCGISREGIQPHDLPNFNGILAAVTFRMNGALLHSKILCARVIDAAHSLTWQGIGREIEIPLK